MLLLSLLAGFPLVEAPPADLDSSLALIESLMEAAEPAQLGMFFAEIGLEASPDEVLLWGPRDFYDMVVDFSPEAPDSGTPDSLMPLVRSLPLELLEKTEEAEVTMKHGSNAFSMCHAVHRLPLHFRGLLQPS